MKKYIIFVIFFFLIVITYCQAGGSNSQDFSDDQKAFVQSLALILKTNEEAYKNIEVLKQSPTDTVLINKTINGLVTSYQKIVSLSKKVSDEFLEYISPEFRIKYHDLMNATGSLIENYKARDLNSEEISRRDKEIVVIEESFWNYFQAHQSDIKRKLPNMEQDLENALKEYNVPTEERKTGVEKSYWGMLWRFIVADFIAVLIVSFVIILLILPLGGLGLLSQKIKSSVLTLLTIPFGLLAGLGQLYFWILWAAFCVYHINYFMDSPTVSHRWLYYLTGFFAAYAPLGYLSSKEQQTSDSHKERNKIAFGSMIYILLTVVAFILFCIFPNLMEYKFISFINDWLARD